MYIVYCILYVYSVLYIVCILYIVLLSGLDEWSRWWGAWTSVGLHWSYGNTTDAQKYHHIVESLPKTLREAEYVSVIVFSYPL